jgi:hypothetical protein
VACFGPDFTRGMWLDILCRGPNIYPILQEWFQTLQPCYSLSSHVAHYATFLCLLQSPDRGQCFGPDNTCGMWPRTRWCGSNLYNFRTIIADTPAMLFNTKSCGTSCCKSTLIKILRPRPVFWPQLHPRHVTRDPLLRPKYFHNFRIIILDTTAMLCNTKPFGTLRCRSASINIPRPRPVLTADDTRGIWPVTLCCSSNIFIILQ